MLLLLTPIVAGINRKLCQWSACRAWWRAPLRYTQDYLPPDICSLIKPVAMDFISRQNHHNHVIITDAYMRHLASMRYTLLKSYWMKDMQDNLLPTQWSHTSFAQNHKLPLALGRCGNFKRVLWTQICSWVLPVKSLSDECHRTHLMINQY